MKPVDFGGCSMRVTDTIAASTVDIMVRTIRHHIVVQDKSRKELCAAAKISRTTADAILRGSNDVSLETLLSAYQWANGTYLALAMEQASRRSPSNSIPAKFLMMIGPEHEDILLQFFKQNPQKIAVLDHLK
jgi:transcriptional regulator with XRE-family HTH domain